MKIAVIHGEVAAGAGFDEQDVLTQVDCVSRGLAALGHKPVAVPVSLNLQATARMLTDLQPAMAFNLVETIAGQGRLIHIVPALLDALKIRYTGAATEAMLLTSNKLLAKRWLTAVGLPTPPWFTGNEADPLCGDGSPSTTSTARIGPRPAHPDGTGNDADGREVRPPSPDRPEAKAWVVKSVWEHASVGLDEDSVLFGADRKRLIAEMDARRESLGGECFAEAYIDGREFNLSLLATGAEASPGGRVTFPCDKHFPPERANGRDKGAGMDRRVSDYAFLRCRNARGIGPAGQHEIGPARVCDPEVLPPAEIRFDAYPPGKVRVVGYRSKWKEGSFEFANTPRSFDFPVQDAALLADLGELALRCWRLFGLRGYARVDFRVDEEGRPWILEVNANPCLSPDAGFFAAALRADLDFPAVLTRIIQNTRERPRC